MPPACAESGGRIGAERVLWPIGPQKATVASALLVEIGGESNGSALGRGRLVYPKIDSMFSRNRC